MSFPRSIPSLAMLCILLSFAGIVHGQEEFGEIMRDRSINWGNPTDRAQAVQRLKAAEGRELEKAKSIARKLGEPFREELPDGRLRVLTGIDDDGELLYNVDRNVNAAISTAADKLHVAPFSIDGSGVRVGVWENASPRDTHVEFNDGVSSRINLVQSASFGYHATHVAGTIAAFGVSPNAKGMAYQTIIDAYTTGNDRSEMTAVGATATGQHATKIYVSNHSYGYTYGWKNVGGTLTWSGTGTDQNGYDPDYGQYSSTSAAFDTIHYNTPYYLAFWAAGNENTDGPSNNQSVSIGGSIVNYDPAIHPQNDGTYSGGFDTLGDQTTAKNVLVVGAVNDAVTGGQRDPSKATKVNFSSTGPCDDGRIKPDLVGNGAGLFSTDSGNDTDYRSLSGTSMATPNLCGTAALLVDLYRDLFSGGAMRGSTLRGLLIHTATDIGNPGPDYTYGWGLVDAEKAAEHIKRQADFPDLETIIESEVSNAEPSQTYTFVWDGSSPIRATLAWTDPAGVSENTHNDRSPDLVNDLDLKLIAPDGTTEFYPFVMPFVGTWTIASMSEHATTGVNATDNVEQVLIDTPGQVGAWRAEVTYTGALDNGVPQEYGLIVSGSDSGGALGFSANDYIVDEDGGTATITVNRVGGTAGAASVVYATSDDTAIAGSDYTAISGSLSWADGDSSPKTFDVLITNDGDSEDYEETINLTLSNPNNAILSGANPATLTIQDDEPIMVVFAPNGGEVFTTAYIANITWSSSLGGNVTIELLRNGLNYYTITSSTDNDGLFEWTVPAFVPTGSGYRIRVSSLGGGGEFDLSDSTFTVTGDPSFVDIAGDLAFSDATYNVGEEGGSAIITVKRSGGTTGAVSVDYATSDGTATAGAEYTATSGTLSWPDGDGSSKSFTVPIINDSDHEDPFKTVNLTLTNTLGAILPESGVTATLNIKEDDNEEPVVDAGVDQNIYLTGSLWSPSELSPSLWLDADDAATITLNGSTVSQWDDKSGNDRHATQSTSSFQPTLTSSGLNGKNVLNFDGSSDYFEVDLDFMAGVDHSVFIVTKTTGYSNIYGAANGGSGANSLHVGFISSSNYRMNYWGNDWNGSITSNFQSGEANLLNYLWLSDTDKEIFANGKSEGTRGSAGVVSTMSGGGRIGKVVTHAHYGGDIAEFIAFDNSLSESERQSMEGFLAHKWGTTDLLVADHPYKNESPGNQSAIANLNGSATDGDSDLLTIGWSVVSGPGAVNFGDPNALNTTTDFSELGEYRLRLTVDDGYGPISRDVVIRVGFSGLMLEIDEASILENGGSSNATVSRAFSDGDLVVSLSSDDTSEATVPASVTILDGQTSASFMITAQDDVAVDLTQIVTITAASAGNPDEAATIDVTDDEVAVLTLSVLTDAVNESDGTGATTATVIRNSDTTNEMIVNLSSNDTSEATVPSSVIISAGQASSSAFDVDAIDDSSVDGTQAVTLTASYVGHTDGVDILDVTDDLSVTLTLILGEGGASVSGGGTKDPEASFTLMETPASGFLFENWTILSGAATIGGTINGRTSVAVSADSTIQANFAPITYSVSYNGNGSDGGSVPVDASSPYNTGTTVTVLGNTGGLSRTGYTFAGWNTASNGGETSYVADDNFSISANTTLFAEWTPDTYTVTYDGNENTGGTSPADQIKTHDAPLALSSNSGTLVKDGYTFAGWNTASDGSGSNYAEGAIFNIDADVTLYVRWNTPPTVAAGDDQIIYLSQNSAWTPSDISTAAWYDAADTTTIIENSGAVSQWNDKSGNGHHLVQTSSTEQPTTGLQTIDGVNAMNFADDFMQTTSPNSNIRAVFFISDNLDGSSTNINVAPIFGEAAANESYTFVRTNTLDYSISIDGNNNMTGTASVSGNTLTAGENIDLGLSVAEKESPLIWYAEYDSNVAIDYLGLLTSNQTFHLKGTIGEFIALEAVPSLEDRQKIEGYLAHKWGLEGNLPVDHPYKNIAPGTPVAIAALDATVTDPDGDPVTQLWTKAGGPSAAVTFDDDTAVDTNANFTELGVYTLRLTADDGYGQDLGELLITVALPPLAVSIADAEISEDGGTTTVTITRLGTTDDLEVTLTSSDTGEATVPATATILDGNTSVDVTVTIVDDAEIDGTQTVTVTATANSYTDGTDTFNVTDDESVDYTSWISGYNVGALTNPEDDFDLDGISNIVENFFGTDPSSYNHGLSAGVVSSGASTTFSFVHPMNENPVADISARYVWSKDMNGFHDDGAMADGTMVDFVQGPLTDGVVSVTATATGTQPAKLFIQIEVTQPAP